MSALPRLLRHLALVLGTGYVLFFFSERVFWSLWRPGDILVEQVAGWLIYSFLAQILLVLVRQFRVRDLWALFLVGAAFGWLAEGVYAMTVFGDPSMPFPLTIAWTSLAWHAPITVVAGWYGLRRALQQDSMRPALWSSLALGLFWGFWAVSWGLETPPIGTTPLGFLAHALLATAALAAAQWLITEGGRPVFRPSRTGMVAAGGIVLAFFVLVTTPTVPIAPAVLLPLFALLLFALWRNRRRETGPDLLDVLAAPIRSRNLACLAAAPIVATAVYGGLNHAGLLVPSHLIVAVVTTVTGSGIFIVAMMKVCRSRKRRHELQGRYSGAMAETSDARAR